MKAKHPYLIAYPGDGNVYYGRRQFFPKPGGAELVTPMTAFDALRALRAMPCNGAVVFRLVPQSDEEVERQAVRDRGNRKGGAA